MMCNSGVTGIYNASKLTVKSEALSKEKVCGKHLEITNTLFNFFKVILNIQTTFLLLFLSSSSLSSSLVKN